MGCTSSKAHADEYQSEARDRRRAAQEAARAEKLRQQLPSPVVQGDLPPWVARQHEVHTPTRADGHHGYPGFGPDDAPAYSEKAEQPYR